MKQVTAPNLGLAASGGLERRPRARAATPVKSETGTLDLALRILEFLAGQGQPIALTTIANTFSASKATVYRHLQGLARHGFVRRDEVTGRYAVGVKLMVLGESARSHFEIAGVARKELMRLRDTTHQAISLCALIDGELVVLDLVHGHTIVEFATRPGTRFDLHASAHGKTWLAFGPSELLQQVLGRPRKAWTPHTLTDAKALENEVRAVKKRGWATAPNQTVTGVNTIAAPVFDHTNRLVGSIAIVGSTQFIPDRPSDALVNEVLAAAQRISRALGWKA
ncbi:MAG: IclR family transcriptional regulator [Pseudorhodoplanes sp.]|jgi:DNA-binding IclR family transcriptional regulator|nr:IclR family transcriptional regulator [Pseudorhodoplanes sp.]